MDKREEGIVTPEDEVAKEELEIEEGNEIMRRKI